jgi:hypothetical protein
MAYVLPWLASFSKTDEHMHRDEARWTVENTCVDVLFACS